MRCNSCQKEIAEPGVAYGINPDALCKCPRGAGDMNAAAKEIKTLDTLIKALKDAAAKKTNPDEILAQRVSFVMGSLKPDSTITREQVRQVIIRCRQGASMNTKAIDVATDEISRLPCINRDYGFSDSANRKAIRAIISKHFPEPSVPVSELETLKKQRAAALKLEADFAGYSDDASLHGLTGAASAFCQCAKELRLALAPKE